MSYVQVNSTQLSLAAESSFAVLPGSPLWRKQQPNGGIKFANVIKKVAREPISATRQDSKGIVVGLDFLPEWDEDLTLDVIREKFGPFLMTEPVNENLRFTGVAVDATGFVIPAATASQAAKLQWVTAGAKSLVYSKGYANSANNGLKVLTADTGLAGTSIAFSGAVVETPPTNATVDIAGIRPATGDLAITVSGSAVTLTSGNNGVAGGNRVDFTTLGWKPGQFVHVGGLLAANQFSAGYGKFRVLTIAAQSVTGDKPDTGLVTDPGAAETVDLLWGTFIRPVSVSAAADDTRFVERYFQGELTMPNLGGAGVDQYVYGLGMFPNQMVLTLPVEDKVTLKASFVGQKAEDPTGTRKTNASAALDVLRTEGFGTAREIGTLRLSNLSAANTAFHNLTVTINNNAAGDKQLGFLGAASVDVGRLKCSFTGEATFTDAAIVTALNGNTTLTFDFMVKNSEGGAVFDFPALTLGNGDMTFAQNKKVRINLEGLAFLDPTSVTQYSLGISTFPVLP